VDEHLADQLLIYMALAKGRSRIRIAKVTTHVTSCIYVCEKFLGQIFTITDNEDGVVTISCDGVGISVP
jgi:RNA 3'-terminal phosphate cyclase (ATP)